MVRLQPMATRAQAAGETLANAESVLEKMGDRTGVDIGALIEAGRRAEEVRGQRLPSNVSRSGPVIHGESAPAKEPGVAPSPRS